MTDVCILFFIDKKYLQNDIVMEKLIQTLFLIIMKNKKVEIKNLTNQSKKENIKAKTIYNSHGCISVKDQVDST